MIGLEFICKAFNMQYKDLAEYLEIKPQTINSWLRGRRNISEIRLKQLSEYFNLPTDYFQKELTDLEKVYIQKQVIKRTLPNLEDSLKNLNNKGEDDMTVATIQKFDVCMDFEASLIKKVGAENAKEALDKVNDELYEGSDTITKIEITYHNGKKVSFDLDEISHADINIVHVLSEDEPW